MTGNQWMYSDEAFSANDHHVPWGSLQTSVPTSIGADQYPLMDTSLPSTSRNMHSLQAIETPYLTGPDHPVPRLSPPSVAREKRPNRVQKTKRSSIPCLSNESPSGRARKNRLPVSQIRLIDEEVSLYREAWPDGGNIPTRIKEEIASKIGCPLASVRNRVWNSKRKPRTPSKHTGSKLGIPGLKVGPSSRPTSIPPSPIEGPHEPSTKVLTNNVGGVFQCTFCNSSFLDCWRWKRHENEVHLTTESWTCQVRIPRIPFDGSIQACHRSFTRKEWLENHHKHDHLPFGIAPNHQFEIKSIPASRCGYCDQTFRDWASRQQHVARHYQNGRLTRASWKGGWGLNQHDTNRLNNLMPSTQFAPIRPMFVEDRPKAPGPYLELSQRGSPPLDLSQTPETPSPYFPEPISDEDHDLKTPEAIDPDGTSPFPLEPDPGQYTLSTPHMDHYLNGPPETWLSLYPVPSIFFPSVVQESLAQEIDSSMIQEQDGNFTQGHHWDKP
ncbi:MAG: hypothetical protein M1814_004189 [Vezdaea aestivalis]|nr:MAG: hypothetical protein M1814_004189 [Vezdaea aestivalis]